MACPQRTDLLAQLADSAQITEDAYRASGSDRLLLLSLQLRRAEADFITHRKVAAIGQFHDGFTELLSATRSSAALDSLGKRHLTELIGRYKVSVSRSPRLTAWVSGTSG